MSAVVDAASAALVMFHLLYVAAIAISRVLLAKGHINKPETINVFNHVSSFSSGFK